MALDVARSTANVVYIWWGCTRHTHRRKRVALALSRSISLSLSLSLSLVCHLRWQFTGGSVRPSCLSVGRSVRIYSSRLFIPNPHHCRHPIITYSNASRSFSFSSLHHHMHSAFSIQSVPISTAVHIIWIMLTSDNNQNERMCWHLTRKTH